MARSLVDVANEQISITDVLLKMGVSLPDSSSGASWKTDCPFGNFYHLDRGGSKSLRVYYASNSAYCFRGCGYLTPVTLYSLKTGLSKADAAVFLLDSHGIELPSLDDTLTEIIKSDNSPSHASLREALHIYCQREVGESWESAQFDDVMISGIDNCLALLSKVDDEEKAKLWLDKSKQYMYALLKGTGYVQV